MADQIETLLIQASQAGTFFSCRIVASARGNNDAPSGIGLTLGLAAIPFAQTVRRNKPWKTICKRIMVNFVGR